MRFVKALFTLAWAGGGVAFGANAIGGPHGPVSGFAALACLICGLDFTLADLVTS